MKKMRTVTIATLVLLSASIGSAQSLTGKAADLYAKALAEGDFTSTFQSVSTEVKATSDNRSFYIRWQRSERPTHWLVLIHGAGNPAEELRAAQLVHRREAGHLGRRAARLRGEQFAVHAGVLVGAVREDHGAGPAALAHEQVRGDADHRHRHLLHADHLVERVTLAEELLRHRLPDDRDLGRTLHLGGLELPARGQRPFARLQVVVGGAEDAGAPVGVAHHHLRAALDRLLVPVGALRDLTLRVAPLDRLHHATHPVDGLEGGERLALEVVGEGAKYWPRWRGPSGQGQVAAGPYTEKWAPATHVWKTAVPGRGNSSPIVWGDRIFLTTGYGNGERLSLLAFSRTDGKQLWGSGRYNNVVYVISTRNGHLITRIPVGSGPHGLAVWPQPGRYSLGHTGNLR